MAKSAISMDAGEIAALENEELAPEPDTAPEKEPVVEVADRKGGKPDAEPEFVAEPEEGEKPKADVKAKKPDDGKPRKAEDEKPKTVPQEAMYEERRRRQRAEATLHEQQIRQARLEERVAAINEALARQQQQPQKTAEPEAVPETGQDPLAVIEWNKQQILADRKARAEAEREWGEQSQRQTAEQQQAQAAQQEWATAYRAVTGYWEQAAAENPQIVDAYNTLRQHYVAEFRALGWQSQQDITNELNRIEAGHILNCYHSGKPIDEFVMELAAARAGWKPKDPDAEEAEPEVKNGKANENADTLKRLAKAQDASDTLSGMGGGAGGNKISLETLDHMNKDEFNALVAKITKQGGEGAMDRALEKMMGIPAGRG